MTSCSTQRSMPCSSIIIETSSCNRRKQMQRATGRHYASERNTLELLALNGLSPSNSSPQGSGNPTEEEAERDLEPEKMEDIKRTRPPNHEQSLYELTETGVPCIGPAWVCTRSSACSVYTGSFRVWAIGL